MTDSAELFHAKLKQSLGQQLTPDQERVLTQHHATQTAMANMAKIKDLIKEGLSRGGNMSRAHHLLHELDTYYESSGNVPLVVGQGAADQSKGTSLKKSPGFQNRNPEDTPNPTFSGTRELPLGWSVASITQPKMSKDNDGNGTVLHKDGTVEPAKSKTGAEGSGQRKTSVLPRRGKMGAQM